MSYNDYEVLDPYGNYGDKNDMSPYEMLMRMKAWNKNIYLTIENMDKEIRTQLSILDQEITSRIDDFENDVSTTLSVMNGKITARIDDFENDVSTALSVMNGEISSKVSKTDYNGNTIASLINQTATSVKILANKIDLSGYVTISSLKAGGTTEIDGSRITTGYISADRIQASVVLAKLVAAGGISADMITSGIISSSRLDANAIRSKLIEAGGISADYITSGTINSVTINSAIINAGIISGVGINTTQDVYVGRNIVMQGTSGGGIQLPATECFIAASHQGDMTIEAFNDLDIIALNLNVNADAIFMRNVKIGNYNILRTMTDGLEITKSTTNDKLLVVKLYGSTLGYIELK